MPFNKLFIYATKSSGPSIYYFLLFRGMINVHASLLPRWRGAAPIFYALANGDKETGITIMTVKPHKFDVGEIVDQKRVEIPPDMKMPELHSKLASLGAELLLKAVRELPENLKNARKQPDEGVTLGKCIIYFRFT